MYILNRHTEHLCDLDLSAQGDVWHLETPRRAVNEAEYEQVTEDDDHTRHQHLLGDNTSKQRLTGNRG